MLNESNIKNGKEASMRKVIEYLVIEKRGLFLREISSGIRAKNFPVRVENIPREEIDERILPPLAHVLNTYHIKQLHFLHCGLLNGRTLHKFGELINSRPIRVDRLDACCGYNGQGFDVVMLFLKNGSNEVLDSRSSLSTSKAESQSEPQPNRWISPWTSISTLAHTIVLLPTSTRITNLKSSMELQSGTGRL